MDELRRIRGLLEVYETAIGEIRRLGDPGLDEFETRLEARAAAAAHDYFEALREVGTIIAEPAWPARVGAGARRVTEYGGTMGSAILTAALPDLPQE